MLRPNRSNAPITVYHKPIALDSPLYDMNLNSYSISGILIEFRRRNTNVLPHGNYFTLGKSLRNKRLNRILSVQVCARVHVFGISIIATVLFLKVQLRSNPPSLAEEKCVFPSRSYIHFFKRHLSRILCGKT